MHIASTMIGSTLIGILMSTEYYRQLQQGYPLLTPAFPNYDTALFPIFLNSLHFWSADKMLRVFLLEIFFSFIYSFTTFTLVHSTTLQGSPATGISEIKRFVSGTTVFLSHLTIGKRATLHLGFTSACAGYCRSFGLLLFFGTANIVGFSVSYIIFSGQMSGGPIRLLLDNIRFARPLLFFKSAIEDKAPSARSHRREEASFTSIIKRSSKTPSSKEDIVETDTAKERPASRKRTIRSKNS